ncbi:MAG: hypothetical protein LBU38_01405 [Propionibacteriaceae bacterium]|jgi:hypothetical protein|nr:hypothetical protein [Propionibacteriaceae bacterium]
MKPANLFRALMAAILSCTLSLGLVPSAAQAKALPPKTSSCAGVWVVVDTGSASTVRCAAKYSNGLTALKSAGFTVRENTPGFICQIQSYPSTCTKGFDGYWSYWHATKASNGNWGAWKYDTKGAKSYVPKKGAVEGWRWNANSTISNASAPAIKPPKGYSKAKVSLTGTAKVGKTLKAKVSFSPAAKYTYQWYRGSAKIKGATKSSYKLKKADKGKKVKVTVKAGKAGYQTVSESSPAKKIK